MSMETKYIGVLGKKSSLKKYVLQNLTFRFTNNQTATSMSQLKNKNRRSRTTLRYKQRENVEVLNLKKTKKKYEPGYQSALSHCDAVVFVYQNDSDKKLYSMSQDILLFRKNKAIPLILLNADAKNNLSLSVISPTNMTKEYLDILLSESSLTYEDLDTKLFEQVSASMNPKRETRKSVKFFENDPIITEKEPEVALGSF